MKLAHCRLLVPLFLAAACSPAPEPGAATPPAAGALLVYAPLAAEDDLAPALAEYAALTGTAVVGRFVDGLPDLVIDKRDSPRADLLVLEGVGDAVRTVDEGALRPLAAHVAVAELPATLRDPEGSWLALTWEPAAIAYDVRRHTAADVGSYRLLAADAFAGQLCLPASTDPAMLAVIAALIEELGIRPAERAVRGWLANLARPPFASGNELVAAIGSGDCGAGIVPGRQVQEPAARTTIVRYAFPDAAAGELLAAGVARHAAQPEAALALLEWLVVNADLEAAARERAAQPAPAVPAAALGWHYEEVRKLAERAGYR